MVRTACASLFAILITLSTAPALAAEGYPQQPIRIIIPFSPGGATDVLARTLSDKLEGVLGTNIVIDNRGGAGGTLGTAIAARAAPDGYTLLFTSPSYTFTPTIYKNLPYDPLKDFKSITVVATVPNILAVHPSMPVNSVRQLIALARKHPGEIGFGSGGRGSNIHLTTELFAYMAKIKLLHVPYKGGGPAQIALMSGEVQMMMAGLASALPFIKSGRMRALAVTSKKRSSALPDLPTIDESGVPGYVKEYWAGLFAPAGVPEPIITRVYQAVAEALKSPEIVKRLAAQGASPGGDPSAEFDAFVRDEILTWSKLIREMKL